MSALEKQISEVGHDLYRKADALDAEVQRFCTQPVTRAMLADALNNGNVPRLNLAPYLEALEHGREVRDANPGATFVRAAVPEYLSDAVQVLSEVIARAQAYGDVPGPTVSAPEGRQPTATKRNGLFR